MDTHNSFLQNVDPNALWSKVTGLEDAKAEPNNVACCAQAYDPQRLQHRKGFMHAQAARPRNPHLDTHTNSRRVEPLNTKKIYPDRLSPEKKKIPITTPIKNRKGGVDIKVEEFQRPQTSLLIQDQQLEDLLFRADNPHLFQYLSTCSLTANEEDSHSPKNQASHFSSYPHLSSSKPSADPYKRGKTRQKDLLDDSRLHSTPSRIPRKKIVKEKENDPVPFPPSTAPSESSILSFSSVKSAISSTLSTFSISFGTNKRRGEPKEEDKVESKGGRRRKLIKKKKPKGELVSFGVVVDSEVENGWIQVEQRQQQQQPEKGKVVIDTFVESLSLSPVPLSRPSLSPSPSPFKGETPQRFSTHLRNLHINTSPSPSPLNTGNYTNLTRTGERFRIVTSSSEDSGTEEGDVTITISQSQSPTIPSFPSLDELYQDSETQILSPSQSQSQSQSKSHSQSGKIEVSERTVRDKMQDIKETNEGSKKLETPIRINGKELFKDGGKEREKFKPVRKERDAGRQESSPLGLKRKHPPMWVGEKERLNSPFRNDGLERKGKGKDKERSTEQGSPAKVRGIGPTAQGVTMSSESLMEGRERGEREQESKNGSKTQVTDIWSWTDEVLASKYEFVKEIGFGNWGSVWECRAKPAPSPLTLLDDTLRLSSPENTCELRAPHSQTARDPTKPDARPIKALKLVHRTKTPTTAARIRSLWTEFKIVRKLKECGGHRNVVWFDEFVITPSYAIVVMDHHPKLMPVCLSEPTARRYFVGLLEGLEFLHSKGVSHNDIKPANILLSANDEPILVDFGFAQSYDLTAEGGREKAFKSSLCWGTPEYLSPERARGELHDEILSDIWSLGVTMYEMVIGRTPFEASEDEEFLSKEQLDMYYERTRRGEFLGKVNISKELSHLIKRMVEPNVLFRIKSCARCLTLNFFVKATPRRAHTSTSASTSSPSKPSAAKQQYSPLKMKAKPIRASPLKQRANAVNAANANNSVLANENVATPNKRGIKVWKDKDAQDTPRSFVGTPKRVLVDLTSSKANNSPRTPLNQRPEISTPISSKRVDWNRSKIPTSTRKAAPSPIKIAKQMPVPANLTMEGNVNLERRKRRIGEEVEKENTELRGRQMVNSSPTKMTKSTRKEIAENEIPLSAWQQKQKEGSLGVSPVPYIMRVEATSQPQPHSELPNKLTKLPRTLKPQSSIRSIKDVFVQSLRSRSVSRSKVASTEGLLDGNDELRSCVSPSEDYYAGPFTAEEPENTKLISPEETRKLADQLDRVREERERMEQNASKDNHLLFSRRRNPSRADLAGNDNETVSVRKIRPSLTPSFVKSADEAMENLKLSSEEDRRSSISDGDSDSSEMSSDERAALGPRIVTSFRSISSNMSTISKQPSHASFTKQQTSRNGSVAISDLTDDGNNATLTYDRVISPISQWSPDTEEFDTRALSQQEYESQPVATNRGIYKKFIEATPGVDRSYSPFNIQPIASGSQHPAPPSRPTSPVDPRTTTRPKSALAVLKVFGAKHGRTVSATVEKQQPAKKPTHQRYATVDWNCRQLDDLQLDVTEDEEEYEEEIDDIDRDEDEDDRRTSSRASQRSISSRVFRFFKASEGGSSVTTVDHDQDESVKNKKNFKTLKRMVSKIVK